jgi:transcriptional regulator with XRE-family HTH domain
MFTGQNNGSDGIRRNAGKLQVKSAAKDETNTQRVERLYSAPGGPLIGWLYDECRLRRLEFCEMAAALGVTYSYINQLRNGIRKTEHISSEFAENCAEFLSIPTIVVKLLANSVKLSDFLQKNETEEEVLDRSLRQMMEDPKVRTALPGDVSLLPVEAKRAIVLMYSEVTSSDFFHMRELPNILFWLQRAAVLHDEAGYQAQVGHRDTGAH